MTLPWLVMATTHIQIIILLISPLYTKRHRYNIPQYTIVYLYSLPLKKWLDSQMKFRQSKSYFCFSNLNIAEFCWAFTSDCYLDIFPVKWARNKYRNLIIICTIVIKGSLDVKREKGISQTPANFMLQWYQSPSSPTDTIFSFIFFMQTV